MDYPILLNSVGFVKLLSTHPIHIVVWGNFPFNISFHDAPQCFANVSYYLYSLHYAVFYVLSPHADSLFPPPPSSFPPHPPAVPLEWLTFFHEMTYMLLLSDIRQGATYAMLFSFWIIFVGEHMMVNQLFTFTLP